MSREGWRGIQGIGCQIEYRTPNEVSVSDKQLIFFFTLSMFHGLSEIQIELSVLSLGFCFYFSFALFLNLAVLLRSS